MEQELLIDVVCSSRFEDIKDKRFENDWIVHLVCLNGVGRFVYKDREMVLRKNDCAVIAHTKLVGEIAASDDLQVELVAAPQAFLRNQLPANNYSIGGCINLYDNPIMPLNEQDAEHLLQDFHRIKQRLKKSHAFYMELMGSLLRTMMYDLFDFHAKLSDGSEPTEGKSYVVKNLMRLLEAGESRQHRDISYYAERLHVSSKYLSDSVKRVTGNSATYLIDRYTIPLLIGFLKDDALSLNQICDEMNFNSISYFSRYCKKHLGMTPSAFRGSATNGKANKPLSSV